MWAILSGIEGNLVAYDAVLADLQRQRSPVTDLFILGDVIAPLSSSVDVIQRLRSQTVSPEGSPGESPHWGTPDLHICQGWWEEQLLILHGLGRTGEPTELIDQYGMSTAKALWDAIPRSQVDWIGSLEFGFFELDCLLIHGSSVSISDQLTPDTPPIQMLDRLMRMDANTLFCGRSGLAFQYEIQQGSMTSTISTLDSTTLPQTKTLKPRQIVGVGNVGRSPGQATYTLYQPNTGQITFQTAYYSAA